MTKIFCTYRNWKSFYIKTDLILYNMKKNSIYLYTTFLELVDLTFYQIELGIKFKKNSRIRHRKYPIPSNTFRLSYEIFYMVFISCT